MKHPAGGKQGGRRSKGGCDWKIKEPDTAETKSIFAAELKFIIWQKRKSCLLLNNTVALTFLNRHKSCISTSQYPNPEELKIRNEIVPVQQRDGNPRLIGYATPNDESCKASQKSWDPFANYLSKTYMLKKIEAGSTFRHPHADHLSANLCMMSWHLCLAPRISVPTTKYFSKHIQVKFPQPAWLRLAQKWANDARHVVWDVFCVSCPKLDCIWSEHGVWLFC